MPISSCIGFEICWCGGDEVADAEILLAWMVIVGSEEAM
jgi:hypothetical protein